MHVLTPDFEHLSVWVHSEGICRLESWDLEFVSEAPEEIEAGYTGGPWKQPGPAQMLQWLSGSCCL